MANRLEDLSIGQRIRITDTTYALRNNIPYDSEGTITGYFPNRYPYDDFIAVHLDVSKDPTQTYALYAATRFDVIPTEETKPKFGKHLPTDPAARKKIPLYSGLMKYFPDALVAVAALSQIGNDQHNAGQPLHWSREKSSDHEDTLMRHLLEAGTVDTDGVRHSTKVVWRGLAALQLEIEKDKANGNNSGSTGSSKGASA